MSRGGERKGAGRKPGSPNKEKNKNTRINVVRVRLTDDEYGMVFLGADSAKETVSEFVRKAIHSYCQSLQ